MVLKSKISKFVQLKTKALFSVNCGTVINGKFGFCACHSCSELEGDCDFNDQCQEGLRCGTNNCVDYFGFDAHTDCCYLAIVGDEEICPGPEYWATAWVVRHGEQLLLDVKLAHVGA